MVDKYTDCPECGHHRSNHSNSDNPSCRYGTVRGPLGGNRSEGYCTCTKSLRELDDHVATFDTRTCGLCGLGNVNHSAGSLWDHGGVHGCMRVMGKKIIEMEREMFSRRSAIRDQKEKNNG